MGSLAGPLASIIVAAVAAIGGYLAQKQVSKSAHQASRLDYEREAYERARAFDTETINRQDQELIELKAEMKVLRAENKKLRIRVQKLEATTYHLERSDDDDDVEY